MVPNIVSGQVLLGEKWRWALGPRATPDAGVVMIFRATANLPGSEPSDFIRRVIAGPGDVVELREGRVRVNGVEATYERKEGAIWTETLPGEHKVQYQVALIPPLESTLGPVRVPPDSVFMAADERQKDTSGVPSGVFSLKSLLARARRFCFPIFAADATYSNLGCLLQTAF